MLRPPLKSSLNIITHISFYLHTNIPKKLIHYLYIYLNFILLYFNLFLKVILWYNLWYYFILYFERTDLVNYINSILSSIDDFMYTNILIILLVIAGIYFTVRTRFVQIRMIPDALKLIAEKTNNKNSISSFQALMISTASRVGTGNIAGVATAISLGGAGSIFWMWVLALIGAASAFIESALAQLYKIRDGENFRGGPAYYIQKALGQRWLGITFAVLLILCFGYGFNALQSYNVGSSIEYYFGDQYASSFVPYIVGGVLAILTAAVIFGGVHRIGIISSTIVPVMALLYIGSGLYICLTNLNLMPDIFKTIFSQAFDFKSIFGGFAGSCLIYGAKRGLFSNEAGMGSAPNAGATADVDHPAKQGLVQMISVFIDTLLICSTTAMMLMIYNTNPINEKGMSYVQQAIKYEFGEIGIHLITISVILFAFSSLIGNYCYAESNLKFIKDNKILLQIFRCSVVLSVFLGALSNFDTVWSIADILMGLMAIVNIVAILLLSNSAIKTLEDYQKKKKSSSSTAFKAADIGIYNTTLWK